MARVEQVNPDDGKTAEERKKEAEKNAQEAWKANNPNDKSQDQGQNR